MSVSCSHLSDGALLRELASSVSRDRANTAAMLALIAEVEDRRLFLPAGYSSMFAYCVGELRMSEDAAYRRIHAARAARKFPEILVGLAAGRLHLSGVSLLAQHLTSESAAELLKSAERKTKSEIERLLAEKFPRPDVPFHLQALPVRTSDPAPIVKELGPGRVGPTSLLDSTPALGQEPTPAASAVLEPFQIPAPRAQLMPLSRESYAIKFTMSGKMHDKLQRARMLLSHRMPRANEVEVLEHALDVLIQQLEKRKFGSTERPREHSARQSSDPRYIPAQVRRVVAQRDGHRCTFVAPGGRRCAARSFLEFDHVEPVARGGKATASNLRLRCRAHNCHTAEQTYGRELVRAKIEARRAAAG